MRAVEHLSIDITVERSRPADGARVVTAVLTVAPVHAGTPRGERRKYARGYICDSALIPGIC
jgi:hypothetical protein